MARENSKHFPFTKNTNQGKSFVTSECEYHSRNY